MAPSTRGIHWWLCAVVLGCSSRASTGGETTDGETGYDGCSESLCSAIQLRINRDVDVLFVIDDSGSMGAAQGLLAAGLGAFTGVLEDPAVAADLRIGVTTTDNGNPWCAATPDGGNLQISSCRSRLGDFVFDGDPPADATTVACTDVCSADTIEIVPTTTAMDPEPRARPWLETIGGRTNIAAGVSLTEALQCIAPQGIAGCGFESHLESMYKTFARSLSPGEDEVGFLRASAITSIVIVSDEVDCSYDVAFESIFLAETEGGDPAVFWSDPDAAAPTSAVCWNAGVVCEGDGAPYDGCRSANKDTSGNVDVPDASAVLHPVARYIDLLQELENDKQLLTPSQEVLVAVIAGVPEDYDGELTYANALDPLEQLEFGIGAGCRSSDGDPTARPPVRERELAEAFEVGGEPNIHSICADDYAPALTTIANAIREQIKPACMTSCVADTDPVQPGVQPQCTLIQEAPHYPSGDVMESNVLACIDGQLPPGEDVCYATKSGDALSQLCADEGWNLEFSIVRTTGVPAPEGVSIAVVCEYSQDKAIDCPALP